MGNCCCDRKGDLVFPEIPKEPQSPAKELLQENSASQEEISEKLNASRASVAVSTAGSDTKEVWNRAVISQFVERLRALQLDSVLSPEEVINTGTWIGDVDRGSARAALTVVIMVQSEEFAHRPMVRFACYTSLKQAKVLPTILSNLVSSTLCIRRCYAHLLEALLGLFHNLRFSLVHDLLAADFFQTLELALTIDDVPEYSLCLSNIAHGCYYRNLYVQERMVLPSCYQVLSLLIKLFRKLEAPAMVRRHADNLRDFGIKHDGEILTENFDCLERCGLSFELERTRISLKSTTGFPAAELEEADKALRSLLLSS